MLNKSLKIIIVLLLSLLTLVLGWFLYLYFSSNPKLSGELQLSGLHGKVIITRDQFGVPHIKALSDDRDAFLALGFVQAQDRFWQMELQRHIVKGTLSELFGSRTLSKDIMIRGLGFYVAAQADIKNYDPHTLALIKAYTRGINDYIKRGHYPLQIKMLLYKPMPWTVVDSIAWQKVMAWGLQFSWYQKLRNQAIASQYGINAINKLLLPYPKQAPIVINKIYANKLPKNMGIQGKAINGKISPRPFTIFNNDLTPYPGKGSNAWVISGKISATKMPILANDPHLAISSPSVWYLVSMTGPHIHVVGASMPGIPAVIIGHNKNIGWGVTNADLDTQNVYKVSNAVIKSRQIKIKVRGIRPKTIIIKSTPYGPVIDDLITQNQLAIKGHYALKWAALSGQDTTVAAFIHLDYADNWQQFKEALSLFVSPSLTFLYADNHDNIGAYVVGKVPLRNGSLSQLPLPTNSQYLWHHYIPFNDMPHELNPSSGMIITANNKIVASDYPYRLVYKWLVPPYRATRIIQYLNEHKPITFMDMQILQADNESLLWHELRPYILAIKPKTHLVRQALLQLSAWNGKMTKDSVGATIFAALYVNLTKMEPKILDNQTSWSQPLFVVHQLKSNGRYCRQTAKTCKAFLNAALQNTINELLPRLGPNINSWQWGRVHMIQFSPAIFGDIPLLSLFFNMNTESDGGLYTVNVGSFDKNSFAQIEGPTYRELIDFSNFKRSKFITTPGQSENPHSKAYSDLVSLWSNYKYLNMAFRSHKNSNTLILIPYEKGDHHAI